MTVRLSGQIVCRNEEMLDALLGLGVDRRKVSIVSGYYGTFDQSGELPIGIEQFLAEHRLAVGAMATRGLTGDSVLHRRRLALAAGGWRVLSHWHSRSVTGVDGSAGGCAPKHFHPIKFGKYEIEDENVRPDP